jgi:hypothetical protein
MYDWISNCKILASVEIRGESIRTDVNVVKESQIEGCPNRVLYSLRENDMTAIIAIMEGIQDICRVVGNTIVVALHVAHLVPRRGPWWRYVWSLRKAGDAWSWRSMVWSLMASRALRP